MRVWLVVGLLGCGHDHENAKPQSPVAAVTVAPGSAAAGSVDSPSSDDGIGQRIADELVKLPDSRLVYLRDLGWIQIRGYSDRRAVWTSSPNFIAEVNHQPPPEHPVAWRDERGRYLAAIHDGDQNPPGEDPDLDVVRLCWSDDFVDHVHHELVDHQRATIPHVGYLAIDRGPAGTHVAFEASPELLQRLKPR